MPLIRGPGESRHSPGAVADATRSADMEHISPVRRIPVGWSLCGGLEGDRVAECLELLDQVGLVAIVVAAADKPVTTEVVVVAVVAEQVPGDHQDRVADGDGGLLLADAPGQPPALGGRLGRGW